MVIFIFEKDMTLPLLMDLYGQVLTDRKRELLDYYYNEDYSLAEISEITGISRQGIRESVKKSEAELRALDDSLQLIRRTQQLETKIAAIREEIRKLLEDPASEEIRSKLEQIDLLTSSLSF